MRIRGGTMIVAAWLLVAASAAAAPAVGPRQTVETALTRVLILAQAGARDGASAAERTAELRRIARETFDFDDSARRVLGRHWQALTAGEQVEFVTLFRDLLEHAYLSEVEATAGELTIRFIGESVDGDLATVRAKIVTGRGTETGLDFHLHAQDGRWRIYDLVMGGFSFVSSYRSQFDRVIRVESYASLCERLRNKAGDRAVAAGPSEP